MAKFEMVSKAQHNEVRLKHAEGLLLEFQRLALNLNPNMPIEANSWRMVELIDLAERANSFIR